MIRGLYGVGHETFSRQKGLVVMGGGIETRGHQRKDGRREKDMVDTRSISRMNVTVNGGEVFLVIPEGIQEWRRRHVFWSHIKIAA